MSDESRSNGSRSRKQAIQAGARAAQPFARDLRAKLAAISATIVQPSGDDPYGGDGKGLQTLEQLLVRSRIDSPDDLVPRRLSVERASWYAPESLAAEHRERIDRLVEGIGEEPGPPEFRVFRREAPLSAASLASTAPAWGRGAAIDRTVGPFTGIDGRQFWFDFYRILRLVPLHLDGQARPALLFYVSELHTGHGGAIRIGDIIRILTGRYRLAGSSIWIRADLLTPGAPAETYVGLSIRGGSLRFSQPPIDASGKLTLPAGANCKIELDLDEAQPSPAASSGPKNKAGSDAAQASIRAPENASLTLAAGGAAVTALADASAQAYGHSLSFSWQAGPAPFYEPALQSVVIPLTAPSQPFRVTRTQSPFATLAGEAAISQAGWTLPVATIDTEAPTAASGPGGLAIQAAIGLSLTWRGLRDGPIRLPSPWIAIGPGLILIADTNASGRYANQRFRLWKDEDSQFRSELLLRYTDSFPVIYAASVGPGGTGAEAVLTATNAEAKLDRPVDVGGTPFPVHTLDSRMLLAYTDTQQWVYFFEDNILVDSLDPDATWPVEPGEAISLAIRNALFTITPVNSLLLFAELRDEEMVERGVVLLGMGMYGLLPTLPDPYAANVSWLRGSANTRQRLREATLLLVASVTWTKAAGDDDPDGVDTAFAFAPLGTQEETIDAWSAAALESAAGSGVGQPGGVVAGTATDGFATTGAQSQAATTGSAAPRQPYPNQRDWDRYFHPFDREQFALLDVSSNADQMGVSFAWFNPQRLEDESYVYYQVYQPQPNDPGSPAYPLEVRDLDLSAQSRFVRAFTVPQISWEPLFNLTPAGTPNQGVDPPAGFNLYPDDGGPTRFLNDSIELVPIAPIPVTDFLVEDFQDRQSGFTGALFTLPFGLRAFAEFSRQNQFAAGFDPAKVSFNRPEYPRPDDLGGELRGGIQLRVDAPEHPAESPIFKGSTLQLNNVLRPDGSATGAGTLGASVGIIFNNEFYYDGNTGYKNRGVPVPRIDFSGYGASLFSRWENPNAAIAATSQSRFDVIVGRTGHEVIQVRSLVYPWGIRVVRTITIFRVSSGYTFRHDSGWQAESDGIYDFRYNVYNAAFNVIPQPNPYEFHPGVVGGVFNIRNIKETSDVPNFSAVWNKANGDPYVDDDGVLRIVNAGTPANERSPQVTLQPIYFDTDVQIDDVVSGAQAGRVPSKKMLGYVQLAPRGEPLPPYLLAQLLNSQFGSLGGPVDCIVNVAQSGQQMRLSRVDVNPSVSGGGQPIFVTAARGAVILPKDGSWSVVQHAEGTGEVTPVDSAAAVPLIRRGILNSATQTTNATANDLLRLANPTDLVAAPSAATRNYGLLQSTDTQKALFRLPSFRTGSDQLLSQTPDFADAYKLLNSAGVFPNVQDTLPLALGAFETRIVEEGYRLLNQLEPDAVLEQILPEGPLYLINEEFLKLYVEYAKKDKNGVKQQDGSLKYGFDSAAADLGKKWASKVNDIGMVVDLGPLTRVMMIKGKFDTEKGASPSFIEPQLEFGEVLKPVVAILQILEMLQGGDYAGAFQKGLQIAMSNSAETWNYALQARKEIPVVKFPPGPAYNAPTNPLKLECHLAVGVYFNEALAIPSSPGQLIPSAGAYIEFGGSLSVMCVSLAAATVYAVGNVDLRVAADIKTGPSLQMKFGFGAEISVGLPVIGTVSILYMVGVEIFLGTGELSITAFLLFRGRAEILGGIVTVQITIEASGTYKRLAGPPATTEMMAQVTFGLDISIFLIINISFTESWQESRQIA